jgi:hypothetical protein
VSQALETARAAALDGPDATAEQPRRLRFGKVVEISKNDHCALLCREPAQGVQ